MSASGEVGVRVLVELEGVLSVADVELDELTSGVVFDDDCSAMPAPTPEKSDVAESRIATRELLRIGVESEAVAGHLESPFFCPEFYDRASQARATVRQAFDASAQRVG
jgi:hypothetical protein